MPQSHQFVKGLTPGWIIGKASEIRPNTVEVISEIMKRTKHIQQGFNAALGVLRLAKVYTSQRLENAAKRCVFYRMKTYQTLKSVLKNNLDSQPYGENPNKQENIVNHESIRGDYQ